MGWGPDGTVMGWRGLGRLERRRWLRVHWPLFISMRAFVIRSHLTVSNLSGVTGNTVMLLAVARRRETSHPHFVVQALPLDALEGIYFRKLLQ